MSEQDVTAGAHALAISDINTTVNGVPRILDLRLAEALGFARRTDIRELIERHRDALERLGGVYATMAQTRTGICATVAQNTEDGIPSTGGGICRTVRQSRGRGRPTRAFWLTKRQAIYLTTKSETSIATEITIQVVEVFDAATSGASTTVAHLGGM